MTTTLETINDNENIEYEGDVAVNGDIGKNVTLKIKNGSLIVHGNVDKNVTLRFDEKDPEIIQQSSPSQVRISFCGLTLFSYSRSGQAQISVVRSDKYIEIHGTVKNNFDCETINMNIKINQGVGSHASISTRNGNITTGYISSDCVIKTKNGNIKVFGEVEDRCQIITHNGNIHLLGNVGNHCQFHTNNGNITCSHQIGRNANIKTRNGNIKIYKIGDDAEIETRNGNIRRYG